MLRLFKFLIFLAIVAFVGLVGYAYLGDLSPETEMRTIPVTLDDQ
ncbi:hypothetical protein [Palleronia sp. LCG004]|nr:hypothetical protein [Palleronia sp. LCG004]WOI57003.1 hypothetical protein RVY76_04225 [Palleronia sp. LCG004]